MDPNRVQLLRIFALEVKQLTPLQPSKKDQALAWKGHVPQQSSLPFRHLGRRGREGEKGWRNFANTQQKS